MLKKHLWWLLPILVMVVFTPFTPILDMSIDQKFYSNGHFYNNAFFKFMYDYGVVPAQIVGVIAFIILCLSYLFSYFKKWREPSLVLVLTIAVGAGFIVHILLKDHWGRPRPKQVVNFGGMQEYRPYYYPNF